MKSDNLPPQAAHPEQTPPASVAKERAKGRGKEPAAPRRPRSMELWLAAAFMLVHLVAPVVIGERYPFTISPMFYDQPAECCTYVVTAADGSLLEAEQFNLHLVYDGNPPGLGMGIEPTETLHPYCQPCQRQKVTDHVRGIMQRESIAGPITIKRRHLFARNHRIADESDQWEISIEAADQPSNSDESVEPSQQ